MREKFYKKTNQNYDRWNEKKKSLEEWDNQVNFSETSKNGNDEKRELKSQNRVASI